MCGFAGEFLPRGRADLSLVRAMAERLVHRGPDEEGHFLSKNNRCAMAFRRLSIIDPSGSHQPMSSEDGLVTVAFNGEIYNYRELRRELSSQGVCFRTEGDTEVLVHLYRSLGLQMLTRLDGMFAIAIYDAAANTILLARDRFGEKPLMFVQLPDRIIFASEAKALLRHPLVDKSISHASIISYLSFGYVPAPASIWSSIHKVLPSHYLQFAQSPASVVRYWQPHVQSPSGTENDLVQKVRDGVMKSVESRMVSDVPLGALLSGGIDSAVVVASMSKAVGRSGGIQTFTAGFDESEFDERPSARQVAQFCGTEHTELLIEPQSPARLLDRIIEIYDEPFGDSSAIPTFLICQAAREHVKVALTGDGGDEVFAGYDRYRAMGRAAGLSPSQYVLAKVVAGIVSPFVPHNERNVLRRFLRFADGLSLPLAEQYFVYRCLFSPNDLGRLLTGDFVSRLNLDAPHKWFCDLYENSDLADEMTQAQYDDLMTYLPDDLLVKTDMASMASSLEIRAPMLQHSLAEIGLSLPLALKASTRFGKVAVRKAFSDMLPPAIITKRKRGFAVPLDRWLREDLLETMKDTLFDSGVERLGIIRPEAVAGLVNDHLSGRGDHRHRLWALLVLTRWLARHS